MRNIIAVGFFLASLSAGYGDEWAAARDAVKENCKGDTACEKAELAAGAALSKMSAEINTRQKKAGDCAGAYLFRYGVTDKSRVYRFFLECMMEKP
jgi:hypothetical protein